MSLRSKSLLFLAVVFALQLALFFGLRFQITKAEQDAAAASYSNRVMAKVTTISNKFHELTYDLLLWLVTKSTSSGHGLAKSLRARYEKNLADLPKSLDQLRTDPGANADDRREIERMTNTLALVADQITWVEQKINSHTSPQKFIIAKQLIDVGIEPLIMDLQNSVDSFQRRHEDQGKTQDYEVERRHRLQDILICGLASDAAAALLIVIVFSTGIIRRLTVVAENFSRYGRNLPLHPVVPGKDEIALLDREFHRLTSALSEAAAKDRIVFESMPVGIVNCSLDGRITDINPKASQFLKLETGATKLSTLRELFAAEPEYEIVWDALQQQRTDLGRVHLLQMDGGSLPVELSVSRFEHDGKQLLSFGMTDMTLREEIERLKQEFVSVVSHDLRSPLTSICACLDILENRMAADARLNRTLHLAKSEATRLIALTTDLLDIAKIEAGNLSFEIQRCDVDYLIERSVEPMLIQAENRQISIRTESSFLEMMTDPERVIQILMNFLSNSLKYSPESSSISVTARLEERFVIVSVTDQGRGIPQDQLQSVFDRFKQTRAADAKQGTGLGLAICKLLAENLGGHVGVSSVEQMGSTFWLALPQAKPLLVAKPADGFESHPIDVS